MADRICSAPECSKPHYGRGWCHTHYMQWFRSEDREATTPKRKPPHCTVDGCEKPVKGNGLCPGHWQRNRRYGSPTGQPEREPTADRFWRNVAESDTGCWEWQGPVQPAGYGKFTVKHRTMLAHRWAYEHMVGEIPDGLQIDHLCFNPPCVRPDHLDPVTAAVNAQRRDDRNHT